MPHDDNRVSLRDFTDSRINDVEDEVARRWEHHEEVHVIEKQARVEAAALVEKANDLAFAGLKEYKAQANEWRGLVSDQQRLFVTKSEHDMVTSRLDRLEDARIAKEAADVASEKATAQEKAAEKETIDRKMAEQRTFQWKIGAVISIISIVGGSALTLLLHFLGPHF
jgi:hypothetical protein